MSPATAITGSMTGREWLRSLYHKLPAPPSTNFDLNALEVDPYELVPDGGIILDLGCGGSRGGYAFASVPPNQRNLKCVGLDLEPAAGVDIRGDAHAIPIKSGALDCVICVSTLEYLRNPQQVLSEIYRVLRPGGLLYLNVPFVFPHHPPPEDLYRFSTSGIKLLAERFQETQAGFNRGPASTFCHLLIRFLAILFCFNSRRAYGILVDLFTWVLFWIKYLDLWIGRYEAAGVIYSGTFFLGRKPTCARR